MASFPPQGRNALPPVVPDGSRKCHMSKRKLTQMNVLLPGIHQARTMTGIMLYLSKIRDTVDQSH
ncbi:hypothetical protein [Kaarinaea lacus]